MIDSARYQKDFNSTRLPAGKAGAKYVLIAIIGLGMGVMLAGCSRKAVPVSHNFYRKDSVIERERLVPIHIPPSLVKQGFTIDQWDSLVTLLKSNPGKRFEVRSTPTDAGIETQLSLMIDKAGNLIAQCESMEETYQAIVKDKERYIIEKEKEIVDLKKTMIQRLDDFIKTALWLGIISTVIYVVVTVVIHKLKR